MTVNQPYKMCVLGLGAVGQRMLEQSAGHPDFDVVAGFDVAAPAVAQTQSQYPNVTCYPSAEEAIVASACDAVYVATPPLYHAELVRLAIQHGKAILCEKPLGVDLQDSADLVSVMQQSGLPHAVNFVFASAPAVQHLQRDIAQSQDPLEHIHIRLHFHQWPRPFQAHADWLSGAAQGGFTREVTSHFIYLLFRLFGSVQIDAVQGQRPSPERAETQLSAFLHAGNVPVTLVATTGGEPQETVSARFLTAKAEWRLENWYQLTRRDSTHPDGLVLTQDADPRGATYQAQLSQLAALMRGQSHSLPDFDVAFQVQRVIESLLAQTPSSPP